MCHTDNRLRSSTEELEGQALIQPMDVQSEGTALDSVAANYCSKRRSIPPLAESDHHGPCRSLQLVLALCAVVEAADNSALPAVPTTPARPVSERVRFADFPRDSERTSDHNHRARQRGPMRPSCCSTDQVSQVLVRSLITAGVAPVVGILGSTFDRSKCV